MARQLIDSLSIEWKPEEWHDTFQEKVAQLLKAKRDGDAIEKAEAPPKSTNVVDLVEALQASVDRAGSSHGRRTSTTADLRKLTRMELCRRATDADVHGRSSMNRDELILALAPNGDRRAHAS
ncbi:hypothetical protein [Streptomyces sp. NPDC050982]|uniref:hypothetical protein n=1 Tax=Streptomyces sp. NPDC050982 TaxID=3154746 RepID=UPI0033FE66D7